MSLISDLIDETLSLTLFFVIGLLMAGFIAGNLGIRKNRIHLGLYDSGDLWRAWRVVMACGIGVATFSVATGLLATGIVASIGRIISSATSTHFLDGFYSENSVSCTSFIMGIALIGAAGALFGALAGVIQHSILGKTIDRPLAHWIKADIFVWAGALVISVTLGLMLGSVAGLTGLNFVLFLGGLIAGGVAADRVMSTAVEKILHAKYQAQPQYDVPKSKPTEPLIIGKLLRDGAALIIALAIVVGVISLLTMGGKREVNSKGAPAAAKQSDPTNPPAPQVTSKPKTPASAFCGEIEQQHPSNVYVCLGSEAGDPVAGGRNWLMTGEASAFTQIFSDGHSVVIHVSDGSNWDMSFAPPSNDQFQVGAYKNAVNRDARIDQATMHVRTNNVALRCGGSFEVLAFEYDNTTSKIKRLGINFVQTCNDTGAKLYGIVRVNMAPGELE